MPRPRNVPQPTTDPWPAGSAGYAGKLRRPRTVAFGWPMALGVVVVLASVSAVAWRLRANTDVRAGRQASPQADPATSTAPDVAAPRIGAQPQVQSSTRYATSRNPARGSAPRMQDVADVRPGSAAEPVGATDDPAQFPVEPDASAALAVPDARMPAQSVDAAHSVAGEAEWPTTDATVGVQEDAGDAVADGTAAGFEDDQPLDEQPPATADSMPVQQAWLQRIAELDAAGDRDGARESLAVFRHRYPEVAIPDALRALEP